MSDKSSLISESFKRRADSAAFFEAYVAAKLSRAGLWVLHHPFTLASETGRDRLSYAQSVDLTVSAKERGIQPCGDFLDVEAKSSGVSFEDNPDSYPKPSILVCSSVSWVRKWGYTEFTERDFLFVSRKTGGILWLPKAVRCKERLVTDRTRNEHYVAMEAPVTQLLHLEQFVRMVKDGT